MKTLGIIAEYNPFHKGHEYLIKKAKEQTDADYCIVVMSGDFVQRGTPSIIGKHERARMALLGGADLVLELPVPYAAGSAGDFAQGAVSVLTETGCVDYLCFGSESGRLEPLMQYAGLFEEEPADFRELFRGYLAAGYSYPLSRSKAAAEYIGYRSSVMPCCADDADLRCLSLPGLSQPNDILGVEYLRALIRQNSAIKPLTVKRKGSAYNEKTMDTRMPGAEAVRSALLSGKDIRDAVPGYASLFFYDEGGAETLMEAGDFSQSLMHAVLGASREELLLIQDIDDDLAGRILNLRYGFKGFTEFAGLLKTKQYTRTRISRALIHIILNLEKNDIERYRAAGYPVYLHALGFKRDAGPLLKNIKNSSLSPLVTKTSDARALLDGDRLALFEKTCFSSDFYEMTRSLKCGIPFVEEIAVPLTII